MSRPQRSSPPPLARPCLCPQARWPMPAPHSSGVRPTAGMPAPHPHWSQALPQPSGAVQRGPLSPPPRATLASLSQAPRNCSMLEHHPASLRVSHWPLEVLPCSPPRAWVSGAHSHCHPAGCRRLSSRWCLPCRSGPPSPRRALPSRPQDLPAPAPWLPHPAMAPTSSGRGKCSEWPRLSEKQQRRGWHNREGGELGPPTPLGSQPGRPGEVTRAAGWLQTAPWGVGLGQCRDCSPEQGPFHSGALSGCNWQPYLALTLALQPPAQGQSSPGEQGTRSWLAGGGRDRVLLMSQVLCGSWQQPCQAQPMPCPMAGPRA